MTPNLNVNLADVETKTPLIAPGQYVFKADRPEFVEHKDTKDTNVPDEDRKWMLVFTFRLTEAVESIKPGVKVPANWPIRKYCNCFQSDNPDAPDWKRDVTAIIRAAFNIDEERKEETPSLNDDTLDMLKDQHLLLRIAVREASEKDIAKGYGDSNEIKAYDPV